MDVIRMFQSVMAIMVGGVLAKFGNQNYEAMKADGGILLPVACLLGSIVLLIFGVRCFVRAFSRT